MNTESLANVSSTNPARLEENLARLGVAGAVVLCWAIVSAAPAFAEEIALKDGKTVVGEVVSEQNGYLLVKTESGHISIAEAKIKSRTGAASRDDPDEKEASASSTGSGRETPSEGHMPAKAASERPVACPKCEGKRYAFFLKCLNCNKSDQPGYKNLGYRYVLCDRCVGKGKLPGAVCPLCTGKGSVYLSKVMPYLGGTRKPPTGYQWCGPCEGTGFSAWRTCPQCIRSEHKGFTFHGEKVMLCQRCGGRGRIPQEKCADCKGRGIVK